MNLCLLIPFLVSFGFIIPAFSLGFNSFFCEVSEKEERFCEWSFIVYSYLIGSPVSYVNGFFAAMRIQ